MGIVNAIILGVVEGVTEFLPISSTGHMILVSSLLQIQSGEFIKTFEIVIQMGAILAIVCLYAKRFLGSIKLYKRLAVAFIPTTIVGFLLYGFIKTYLFSPFVVSLALIVGGVVLIAVDRRSFSPDEKINLNNIPYKNAFMIGLIQSVSVIPGVSRAAATILGGMFNGLTKKQATEFSFLLAVPTMFAATGYDLLKTAAVFSSREFTLLILGSVVSFLSALIAVKLFVRFVDTHGFAFFGYYRIVLGVLFLIKSS